MTFRRLTATALAVLTLGLAACGGDDEPDTSTGAAAGGGETLTIYSGREEEIVAPLFEKFTEATGINVEVRYGGSSELAAQIAEEGDNSPADVFFSQDAGALGTASGRLATLPQTALDRVAPDFRAADGKWVGTSARVRVVAYNTEKYSDADLPDTIADYTDAKFKGRIGIAPSNASFQAFVSAMRVTQGDEKTKQFLTALKDNGAKSYEKNSAIMDAIVAGEVDLGFVNHYYLALVTVEQPDAPVANKFLAKGDPGSFVNVAGVGVLASSAKPDAANRFVEYLLSEEGQRFYADEASENEYPLIAGVEPAAGLPPLADLEADGASLAAVAKEAEATLALLDEVGLIS
jgi:iron(III) transport system substrate-binding protein